MSHKLAKKARQSLPGYSRIQSINRRKAVEIHNRKVSDEARIQAEMARAVPEPTSDIAGVKFVENGVDREGVQDSAGDIHIKD